MLTDDERSRGAQLLFDAERQRKAIPQLSKTFPGIEIVDAYRIQDLWAELKMAPGVGVAGHKIGLTSRAMQIASKMTEQCALARSTPPPTPPIIASAAPHASRPGASGLPKVINN
jgi:2-keto-4-pentenoate hydratase